ncbi:hypothetical protein JR316_0008875 [Psilocybe cubensis]|uniref:Uncharacterized protein n=1 Tax=Psilocybe cubensis TaxID=181762 RepID=A0ACB8GRR7_PSICU|nr:hypothetical protein JR316_0008875 [Psilocybe cubensis]KAH9478420.1 hypothetical protein JR316_0008875 [Psilocybe cubensis]
MSLIPYVGVLHIFAALGGVYTVSPNKSTRAKNTQIIFGREWENTLDDSKLARRESTAHVLAATLGFLSLDDGLQKEIYDNVASVVALDRDPAALHLPCSMSKQAYEHYNTLYKYPPEQILISAAAFVGIRGAFEDTMMQIPDPRGPADTMVSGSKRNRGLHSLHCVSIAMTLLPEYSPRYLNNHSNTGLLVGMELQLNPRRSLRSVSVRAIDPYYAIAFS